MLTTTDVAKKLGVTPRRVQALISSGRLKARRIGRDWLVDAKDIGAVKVRRPGRPQK